MRISKYAWILGLLVSNARAQSFTAADFSQYMGLSAVYANPCWIVASPNARQSQLGAVGASFDNDYWALEAPFTPWQLLTGTVDPQYKNANGKIQWQPDWLTRNDGASSVRLSTQVEFRGPAFAKQLGTRLAWSTQTRTRSYLQVLEADPSLLKWAETAGSGQSQASGVNLGSAFHLQSSAWQEWAGSLAAVPVSNGSLRIRLGATAKLYMGLGYVEAKSAGTRFKLYGQDSLTVFNSDMQWSYSSPRAIQALTGSILSGARPSLGSISGVGLGFDLGAVVEFGRMGDAKWRAALDGKPSFGANPYRAQLAFSLLDMGGIRYGNELTSVNIFNDQPKTLVWDTAVWAALAQGQNALFTSLESFAQSELNYSKTAQKRSVRLPATWVMQGNYRFNRWLQLGVQWKHNNQALALSSVRVVPRFESKWFELGTPLALLAGYRDFGAGAFLRIGPVWLGSDKLFSSLFQNKKSDLDLYAGISLGWKLGDSSKKN